MNTFLPFNDFMESARCLDNLSLRKQRLEVLQVLESCLRGQTSDPVVQMWHGFEIALCHFGLCCCAVWKERGYTDNLYGQFQEKLKMLPIRKKYYPPWLGQEEVHSAYRLELVQNNPEWYGQFNWSER